MTTRFGFTLGRSITQPKSHCLSCSKLNVGSSWNFDGIVLIRKNLRVLFGMDRVKYVCWNVEYLCYCEYCGFNNNLPTIQLTKFFLILAACSLRHAYNFIQANKVTSSHYHLYLFIFLLLLFFVFYRPPPSIPTPQPRTSS